MRIKFHVYGQDKPVIIPEIKSVIKDKAQIILGFITNKYPAFWIRGNILNVCNHGTKADDVYIITDWEIIGE